MNVDEAKASGDPWKLSEAYEAEVEKLRVWVDDLHSGMYINCVYCGHRYGPKDEVPAIMADVLKEHVERCSEHPMSKLKTEVVRLRAENAELRTKYASVLNELNALKANRSAVYDV